MRSEPMSNQSFIPTEKDRDQKTNLQESQEETF